MNRSSTTLRDASARAALWAALLAGLLSAGCATTGKRGSSLLPTQHQVKTGPFVIYSNSPVEADSPAVLALGDLKDDLAAKLDCREDPIAEPIEVYVLDDRNAFLHLLRFYFPELPPRRAFFMAQGNQRVVYTYLGPKLEEDLRHEATHALLRGRFGDIPLWLDEGLAEYFEAGPNDLADRNARLTRIADDRQSGWSPSMTRLESLADIHQMTPRDYRESWAWVDLLLGDSRSGSAILVDHLQHGRDAVHPDPLSKILAAKGTDALTLIAHLEAGPPQSVVQKPGAFEPGHEPLIRLQDRPLDSSRSAAPPPRPGLFRRLAGLLGL
ncbi:DUF1570 domain-containing protein [Paludisphaera borealis]|uniref:DUF1570 domain-containing protein n=1 Tax=Paludisphaera borealis TaxID=1387353 RepID=A0A1U7CWU5_9BACT|nr:DUF1570 domain-containing protein [Paludisphaera borealis]APW63368.1 hypothetical protein BSF38_04933 [Paludisphaera borealis]